MKSTIELLDAVKARHGLTSDYQLAQHWNVSRATISKYRSKAEFLSEEMAAKVAADTGESLALILACAAAERARTPSARDAWRITAARLGGAALVALLAYFGAAPWADWNPMILVDAAAACGPLCIMSNVALAIFIIAINLLPFTPREQ